MRRLFRARRIRFKPKTLNRNNVRHQVILSSGLLRVGFYVGEGTRSCLMVLEPAEARRLARMLLMLADDTEKTTAMWDAERDAEAH